MTLATKAQCHKANAQLFATVRRTQAPTQPMTLAQALQANGFVVEHIPESWEDVGGPESGPRVVGGPAYDLWIHHGCNYAFAVQGTDIIDHGPYHDSDLHHPPF